MLYFPLIIVYETKENIFDQFVQDAYYLYPMESSNASYPQQEKQFPADQHNKFGSLYETPSFSNSSVSNIAAVANTNTTMNCYVNTKGTSPTSVNQVSVTYLQFVQ